jgi:hypothetical protein
MPTRSRLFAFWALGVAACLAGCESISYKPKGTSPLAPLQLTADSAELEIVFVHFPAGDQEIAELWPSIDEQVIPASLRAELAANGLRAGIIGGQTPAPLAHKLSTADDYASRAAAAARIDAEPAVHRSHMQIHRGQPGNIIASGVYEHVSPLIRDQGQLSGDTYSNAQADFIVNVDPKPDRRVSIGLVPELKYGAARQQYVVEDGVWRLDTGKPKKTFDKLKLEATLAPGQMLIVTSLPERPGSLGHYFFTESKTGHLEQKLLVIHLTETKSSDLFVHVNEAEAAGATGN